MDSERRKISHNEELLIRLDERMNEVSKSIQEIKINLDSKYVTREEFKPIKMMANRIAGTIISLITLALLGLIFKTQTNF